MKICYIFLSVICLLSLSIAETTENLQEQDAYQLPAEHEVTKLKNNLTILIKQHEEIKKKQLDFLDMYSETKKEIDNFIESVRENDVVRDNDVYFLDKEKRKRRKPLPLTVYVYYGRVTR